MPSFRGYNSYYTSRYTSILVHSDICSSQIPIKYPTTLLNQPNKSTDNYHCTWVKILLQNNKPLLFCSYYRPNNKHKISVFDLSYDIQQVRSKENTDYLTIGGDFNLQHPSWGAITTDKLSHSILDLCCEENFAIINNGQPTHISNSHKTNSFIDLTLISRMLHAQTLNFDWNTHPSERIHKFDHVPITFQINLPTNLYYAISEVKWNIPSPESQKWKNYREILDKNLEKWLNKYQHDINYTNIDQMYYDWGKILTNAALDSIGVKTSRKPNTGWWNPKITPYITEAKRLRRKFYRNKDPTQHHTKKHEWLKAERLKKREIRKLKYIYNKKVSNQLNNSNNAKFWSLYRKLTSAPHSNIPPLYNTKTQSVSEFSIENANTLAEHILNPTPFTTLIPKKR